MASPTWNPSIVLGLGEIHSDFRCIGQTSKRGKNCTFKIGVSKRAQAFHILKAMSLIDTGSSNFQQELDNLADLLLCSKNLHNVRGPGKQHAGVVQQWQWAIEDFTRRGGDTVMGEADDTYSYLRGEISDFTERLGRVKISSRCAESDNGM